jgi:hypothetical protein
MVSPKPATHIWACARHFPLAAWTIGAFLQVTGSNTNHYQTWWDIVIMAVLCLPYLIPSSQYWEQGYVGCGLQKSIFVVIAEPGVGIVGTRPLWWSIFIYFRGICRCVRDETQALFTMLWHICISKWYMFNMRYETCDFVHSCSVATTTTNNRGEDEGREDVDDDMCCHRLVCFSSFLVFIK